MKNHTKHIELVLALLFFFTGSLWAVNCPECRYISPQFDSLQIVTVQFGEGVNSEGDTQQLFMDIYLPVGDTLMNRPLLIFAFGGGFIQGDRFEGYVVKTCSTFARAGFVAAAIDYRTGYNFISLPNQEVMRMFFRPMQDMRAAIQFFRGTYSDFGNPYGIDTGLIFTGGASAGAITALMTEYCDKDAEFGEITDLAAIAGLGGFYSSSSLNYGGLSWRCAGVVNIAGALVNADWIEPGDAPVVSAHGDADLTVPYKGGTIPLGVFNFGLQGSFLVDSVAALRGVCSHLYTIEGGGHPSGSAPDYYFNNIYYRVMPRLRAIIEGRTFCCDMTAQALPAGGLFLDTLTEVSLNNSITGAVSPNQVLWCQIPCGVSANTDSLVVPADSGAYYSFMAFAPGCLAPDFIQLLAVKEIPVDSNDTFISLSETGREQTARVFPNPVKNVLYVELKDGAQSALLHFFDLSGKQILFSEHLSPGLNIINVSNLPEGLFFYRIGFPNGERVFGKLFINGQ